MEERPTYPVNVKIPQLLVHIIDTNLEEGKPLDRLGFKGRAHFVREALKDDGLLVFWFSHRDMRAWKAVVSAINEAEFSITHLIPLPSEHPTRSITKGGLAGINRVIIVIARKKEKGIRLNQKELLEKFREYIRKSKLYPGEHIPEEEIRVLTEAAQYALQGLSQEVLPF